MIEYGPVIHLHFSRCGNKLQIEEHTKGFPVENPIFYYNKKWEGTILFVDGCHKSGNKVDYIIEIRKLYVGFNLDSNGVMGNKLYLYKCAESNS